MSTKTIDATVLRNHFGNALNALKNRDDVLLIRRRGKIERAIVNVDLLEDLLLLHDNKYLESIRKARSEKESFSHEEVFGNL